MKRIESDYQALAEFSLEKIKALKIDGAQIFFSKEKGFSVTSRLGEVETLTHHYNKQFSLVVYDKQRTGSACSSDFSTDAIEKTIEKAITIACYSNEDLCAGLPDPHRLAKHYPDCQLYYSWEITPVQAIAMAVDCEQKACHHDIRITHSEGVTISTVNSDVLLANTSGFFGQYSTSEHYINCSLVAKENDCMQRDEEFTVSRNPNNLNSIEWVAKQAAEKTIRRLHPKRLSTQISSVIFESSVAKSLLSAFVQAVSGANLYRQSSFLLNALGKTIFPDFVTIAQNPHLPSAMGSAPFDQDGVLTEKQSYVEQGRLVKYMLGTYSARKLGLQSTGNAGGVFNLSITHTDPSLEALIKKMHRGLLITELLGQGLNITTGDYSRGASGFWVDNGVIQYPVEEVTVAHNLKQMFKQIVAVAADIDYRGTIHTGSILIEGVTVAGY